MTRVARHEYVAALRARYQAAGRQERSRLLDEFCRTTGGHRKAAIRLLHHPPSARPQRRERPRRYGPELRPVLERLWTLSDRPCAKLLAPFLPPRLDALDRHGELRVPPAVRAQLVTLSTRHPGPAARARPSSAGPPAAPGVVSGRDAQRPSPAPHLRGVDARSPRLAPGRSGAPLRGEPRWLLPLLPGRRGWGHRLDRTGGHLEDDIGERATSCSRWIILRLRGAIHRSVPEISTQARSVSATLQACAMQPRGAKGDSPSKISAMLPTP